MGRCKFTILEGWELGRGEGCPPFAPRELIRLGLTPLSPPLEPNKSRDSFIFESHFSQSPNDPQISMLNGDILQRV